jgi:hypothetical protein
VRKQLLQWVTAARVTFNRALHHERTNKVTLDAFKLRSLFVNDSIVEREKLIYNVHGGCTASGDIVNGGNTMPLRGNRRPNGRVISKTPNPNLSDWMRKVPKEV